MMPLNCEFASYEGSSKTPKGAKGARFFVCTLLHSSRTLHLIVKQFSLTFGRRQDYPEGVAKKNAAEFGDSNTHSGQAASCGFFTSVYLWHSFNGGAGWGGLRACRWLCVPVRQPRSVPSPSFGDEERITAHTGGQHA